MSRFLILILVILVCSCAHPTAQLPHEGLRNDYALKKARRSMYRSSVRYRHELEERVGNVHYNLMKSTGQELCDRKLKPAIGIVFGRSGRRAKPNKFSPLYDLENDYIEDYNAIHKYSEGNIYVMEIFPSSAAYKSGIRRGDKVMSVYGVPTPSGEESLTKLDELLEQSLKSLEPAEIIVERNHQTLIFKVTPDEICPYDLVIDTTSHEVNAYADGEKIIVTIELIDYFNDDNMLAAVMGHELAHSTLGHIQDQRQNEWMGAFGGFFVDIMFGTFSNAENLGDYGRGVYSKDYELEADYFSVYYTARAGYDFKKAQNVHRLLANRDFGSLYAKGTTHPQPQERYVLMQDTVEEIKLKKAFGDDIVPSMNEHNSYLEDKKDY